MCDGALRGPVQKALEELPENQMLEASHALAARFGTAGRVYATVTRREWQRTIKQRGSRY